MSDSDSGQEKTEEGSEKKTREAIEGGNTPFSREASVFLSLGAMLIIASMVLANNVSALVGPLEQVFANASRNPFGTPDDALNVFQFLSEACVTFLMPIMILLMAAGIVAGFAQGVPRLALDRIQPKWSKLSPAAGLKRMFGRDGQIEFLKTLLKFTICCAVISIVLQGESDAVLQTLYVDPSALGGLMLAIVGRLLAGALVAYTVLAGGDLVWARLRWRRELRMSKQEVKDEMKQSEGDPALKAKRRSLALDRSRRRMMAAVPKATLVIANPTHYAIALRYVREEGGAPKVIAKGQDLIALKIREIAENNNIPVIEDKALARSMYDHVEVSQLIPAEFYKAVAEIIHFLQARGARPARSIVKA
jgi:flagellar biosynthetic protein FlhB